MREDPHPFMRQSSGMSRSNSRSHPGITTEDRAKGSLIRVMMSEIG